MTFTYVMLLEESKGLVSWQETSISVLLGNKLIHMIMIIYANIISQYTYKVKIYTACLFMHAYLLSNVLK